MGKPVVPDLVFHRKVIHARLVDPGGNPVEKPVEIRTHPITGRTCRITFARKEEKEAGTDTLPEPPPDASDTENCPFCRPQLQARTPRLAAELGLKARLTAGTSILFPNLFPYGRYSAVSTFDDNHYVPIGTAAPESYADSLLNCQQYLERIGSLDPEAVYMAVTQNHLPSAGGSLVHPHFQVHADRDASNHHRFYGFQAEDYCRRTGAYLFSDYLAHEQNEGTRIIGSTGRWQWMAAFAPEGFFEIWGFLPGVFSMIELSATDRKDLAAGILNAQKFYRSLNRNGYNMGILFIEKNDSRLELRTVMTVRSNYAPWVRSDHTGYEVMLGDMATFNLPEETARLARPFWHTAEACDR
jgi:galactose-1-phosphate uridylyltransferase